MRRAAKTDGNHQATRDYLRKAGWSVHDTSAVGGGFPDLVVARGGLTALVEVKDGRSKDKRQHALRPNQEEFAKGWKGVCIKALSPEDAERQLNLAETYRLLVKGF